MKRVIFSLVFGSLVFVLLKGNDVHADHLYSLNADNISKGKLAPERVDPSTFTMLGSGIGLAISAASTTLQNQINFLSASQSTASAKNDAVATDTQTIRTAVSTNAVALASLQAAFSSNTINLNMLLTQGTTLTIKLEALRVDTTTIKSVHDTFTSTAQAQITNALNSNATAQTYAEATRNAISTTTTEMHTLAVPTRVSNEGSNLGNVTALDFVGSAVDAAISGTTVTVTVTGPLALGFTDETVYVSSPTQIDCKGPGISCRKFGDVLQLEVLGSSSTDWTVTGRIGGVVIGTSIVGAPDVVSVNSDGFIAAISTLGGSNSGSGNIYVQNGNYDLTKAIGFPSGITTYCASSTSLILSGANSALITSGTFVNCNFEIYGTGVDKVLLNDGARILGGNVNKVTVETGATQGKFVLRHSSNVVIDKVYFRNISYTAANAALFLHQGATNFIFSNNTVDAAIANSGSGNNWMEYVGGTGMQIKDNTMAFKNRAMFADIRAGGELGGLSSNMTWDHNTMSWTTFADGSGLFFVLSNTAGIDLSTANTFTHNTITLNTTGTETLWGLTLTNGKVSGIAINNNTIQNVNLAATVTVMTQDTEAEGTMFNNYVTGFDTFISGSGSILYTGRNNYMDGTQQ